MTLGYQRSIHDDSETYDGSYFQVRMSPTFRRRKEAERLLQQRRRMDVMDRNATTPELMTSWRKRSLSASPTGELQPAPTRARKSSAKLTLPPIQAQKGSAGSNNCLPDTGLDKGPHGDSPSAKVTSGQSEEPADLCRSARAQSSRNQSLPNSEPLPPVFVTENSRVHEEANQIDR